MPLPLAAIGLGISAATGLAQIWSENRQNKKNIEFQKETNEQQRQWALEDWDKQNAYNHPLEQMNRLRQAGLNPNLVYGKGADTTADAIRSVNTPAPQSRFNTGVFDKLNAPLQQMYDLETKQAQIDNLGTQNALMQQEALFKQASTAKTVQDTAKSKFDLQQAGELKDSVIQNAKLQNEKLKADTAFTLDQNQRNAMSNSQDVKLTAEKIITEKIAHAKDQSQIDLLKAQLENLKQNTAIQVYERQLTEMGIHKSDPWYFRALMNLVNGNIVEPKQNYLGPSDPENAQRLWDKLTNTTRTATRVKKQ